MIISINQRRTIRRESLYHAFTLIELLIVMTIFILLSAIALPTVRKLLSDQKTSRAASSLASYIDVARNRAIAEGRPVGIRFERLTAITGIEYGTAACLRARYIVGVPPYSGESADAKVTLSTDASSPLALLAFDPADNQLLTLGSMTSGPIKNGDLIELPGGNRFHLSFNVGTPTNPKDGKLNVPNNSMTDPLPLDTSGASPQPIYARINLKAPADGSGTISTATLTQPSSTILTNSGRRLKYRIYRAPVTSSAAPLSFQRGVAVDLTYSGLGANGSEFSPDATALANSSVDLIFGPDGKVEFCSVDSHSTPGAPTGLIFFCVGNTDGVQPTTPLATTKRATANIRNPNSVWVIINPTTGRVVTAPFASVPSSVTTVPTAVAQARSLALLSDTLDAAP